MNNTTPVKIRSAEICLIEERMVQVITAENYETTIDDVDEISKEINKRVGDQTYFLLVIPKNGSSASNETKEYAAQQSFRQNIIAEAIVIPNIAIRLMAVAYMRVNRPRQSIKLFNTKEKALKWLRQLKSGKNL